MDLLRCILPLLLLSWPQVNSMELELDMSNPLSWITWPQNTRGGWSQCSVIQYSFASFTPTDGHLIPARSHLNPTLCSNNGSATQRMALSICKSRVYIKIVLLLVTKLTWFFIEQIMISCEIFSYLTFLFVLKIGINMVFSTMIRDRYVIFRIILLNMND